MTDFVKKEKKGTNPVAAVVAGAVVGAGLAVAGSVLLKDKKSRDKVKKVLDNVKDQAKGYIDTVQKQVEEKKDVVEKKVEVGKKVVKKVDDTADAVKKTLKS